MKLFENEAQMQEWLEAELNERDGFNGLIVQTCPDSDVARSRAAKKIEAAYEYCMESLPLLDIISTDENIALASKESLKPDILAYAPETQCIVIIELKNIREPTRQAGTELSAYCAEVNNYLPFISDADIVNVIVSNEWPTLLRRHAMQDILWRGRKLLCLQPYKIESEIFLKTVSPEELGCSDQDTKLATHHIGGYQLCLYDQTLYTKKTDRNRLDQYLPQMRSAMAAMAAKGNLTGNHGFAFLWKDDWEKSVSPYNITMMNVAPFKGLDRFLINKPMDEDLTDIQERFFGIVRDHDPEGHGKSLTELTNEATRYLDGFCSPRPEGFLTWPSLREILNGRAKYISFASWGFFGELHLDLLQDKYEAGQSPSFDDPDLGFELVSSTMDDKAPYIDLAYFDWDDEKEFFDDNEEDAF